MLVEAGLPEEESEEGLAGLIERTFVTLYRPGLPASWRLASDSARLHGKARPESAGVWLERKSPCCGKWNGVVHAATYQDPYYICDHCYDQAEGTAALARAKDNVSWAVFELKGAVPAMAYSVGKDDLPKQLLAWCEDEVDPLEAVLLAAELEPQVERELEAFTRRQFEKFCGR